MAKHKTIWLGVNYLKKQNINFYHHMFDHKVQNAYLLVWSMCIELA
jgi:hypothetical protein